MERFRIVLFLFQCAKTEIKQFQTVSLFLKTLFQLYFTRKHLITWYGVMSMQIAMISPGMNCCEHTLNTLRYADR